MHANVPYFPLEIFSYLSLRTEKRLNKSCLIVLMFNEVLVLGTLPVYIFVFTLIYINFQKKSLKCSQDDFCFLQGIRPKDCEGPSNKSETCNTNPCDMQWSTWSNCSAVCGKGSFVNYVITQRYLVERPNAEKILLKISNSLC